MSRYMHGDVNVVVNWDPRYLRYVPCNGYMLMVTISLVIDFAHAQLIIACGF